MSEQQLIQKATQIKQFRKRAEQNDNPEFQKKRQRTVDWFRTITTPLKIKRWKGQYGAFYYSVEQQGVDFLEMYKTESGEILKGKIQDFQYPNKWINTRTKLLTETRAEIDKLDYENAFKISLEIIKLLQNKGLHFAVFYSEGQRSPHMIIYDFYELRELNTKQRYKAQFEFWKSVCPFFMQYLDFSVWVDGHLLPLEFAPHYRTGNPFNLIMEWIPGEEKCKD